MMAPIKGMAEEVRQQRKPVSKDNPLLALETMTSSWITTWLDSYRLARDAMTEAAFLATYGSPLLQAFVGQAGSGTQDRHHIERDLGREAASAAARLDIESLFEQGGVVEAILRALVYVRASTGSVDERGFGMLKAARSARPAEERLHLADIKKLIREQYLVVRLDEERAIRALPLLLAGNNDRPAAFDVVRRVADATGALSEDEARRLERVQALFLGRTVTEAAE